MSFVRNRSGFAIAAFVFAALAACGGRALNAVDGAADRVQGGGLAGTPGGGGGAGTNDGGAAGAMGAAGTTGGGVNGGGGIDGGTAGRPGSAGVDGAAGTSGAAGTFGICTPGTYSCYRNAPFPYGYVCLADGTFSSERTTCGYGCDGDICRQCFPGDVLCASATSAKVCPPNGAAWSQPMPCENGCAAGICQGLCKPGQSECVNNSSDVRTCGGSGIWGPPTPCEWGCSGNACRECDPGVAACITAKSGRRCSENGFWGSPYSCTTECRAGGQCADCAPGNLECVDDKHNRSCNDNGLWDPPIACTGVCIGGECVACRPGQVACYPFPELLQSVMRCDAAGSWTDGMRCSNVCKAGACTTNPKKVFVTSTKYKGGELGGLAGADAKCQARAQAAGLPGTFRAWLSDATGTPAMRFTKDAGPYTLVTGGVVANNWIGLASGNLRHSINVTELGTAPTASTTADCVFPIVWTNTTIAGGLVEQNSACGDWKDSTRIQSFWGTTASEGSEWTQACAGGSSAAIGCGALAPIYCFEQ